MCGIQWIDGKGCVRAGGGTNSPTGAFLIWECLGACNISGYTGTAEWDTHIGECLRSRAVPFGCAVPEQSTSKRFCIFGVCSWTWCISRKVEKAILGVL